MSASLYGINVDLAIVNKIMPPLEASNSYYTEWSRFHYMKVDEAKSNFYPIPVKQVPLYSNELAGIEMLRANANLIFTEDEDPSKIFYHGKPFSLIQEGSSKLRLEVKVPFTKKENFDIRRSGGNVILKVKNPTGYLVNIIPLPTITFDMKMVGANIDNHVLNIIFEKR
jgi:arsenite-transporting ATPase